MLAVDNDLRRIGVLDSGGKSRAGAFSCAAKLGVGYPSRRILVELAFWLAVR